MADRHHVVPAAEDAATRARHVAYQSEALAWRAPTENDRRNNGQALADATQAVRLAETIDDKDRLAQALSVLGAVQIALGDLAGAAATVNREIAAASQAKESAAYYAYLNRADVFMKTAERCDYQREFEPCYQMLDKARADLQLALGVARKLGYSGLARQAEEFIGGVEVRRALVKRRESSGLSRKNASIFHPKKPTDVLSTEKFVAPPGDIPPLVAQMYESSKRLEKQAGPFAAISDVLTQYTDGLMSEMRATTTRHWRLPESGRHARWRPPRAARRAHPRHHPGQPDRGLLRGHPATPRAPPLCRSVRDGRAVRSRALADLLASRTLTIGGTAEQQLYTESTVLRSRIGDAQGRLFELASMPDAKPAPVTALQTEIRRLEEQYQTVASRMATESPRLQHLVSSTPATLKALQASMRTEGYELLQYLVARHGGLSSGTSGPTRSRSATSSSRRAEVIDKVAALQKSLADRQRASSTRRRRGNCFCS